MNEPISALELLDARIHALGERFATLSEALRLAAADLLEPGQLPDVDLFSELAAITLDFAAFRDELAVVAAQLDLVVPSGERPSLSAIEQFLDLCRQTAQKTSEWADLRSSALAALDRVEQLTHATRPDFEPLTRCRAEARALKRAIQALNLLTHHPAEQLLADGRHAFCALLNLVTNTSETPEEQIEEWRIVVAAAFGGVLATTATMRKLTVVASGADPQPSEEQPVTATGLSREASDVSAPASLSQDRTGIKALDGVGTTVGVSDEAAIEIEPTDTSDPDVHPAKSVDKAAPPDDAESGSTVGASLQVESAPAETIPAQTSTSEDFETIVSPFRLATAMLNGGVPRSREAVNRLVWHLLAAGELPLALHCAQYVQASAHALEAPTLPPWVIRAALYGRHLQGPFGEIARQVKDDFGGLEEESFAAGDAEWNTGLRFLLAAGALRPALFAPGTGASAVLHSLHLKEGLSQTFKFCDVIAAFGDRHHPLDPGALRVVRDAAVWQLALDQVRSRTEAWIVDARKRATLFGPATKVWRNWLDNDGLVRALLRPITSNDVARLSEVESQLVRLRDENGIRAEIDYTDRHALKRPIGGDIIGRAFDQLRRLINEALALAQDWVDLQRSRPGQPKDYTESEAEKLRQTLTQTVSPLLKELNRFEADNESVCVRAGVRVFLSAVEDIGRLLQDDAEFRPEPDWRDLSTGILLFEPSLDLDENWQPEGTAETLAVSVLKLIAEDRRSALQVYEQRQGRRDHLGNRQLIEWLERSRDAEQAEKLQKRLESDLSQGRIVLIKDAEDAQLAVQNAVSFGWLRDSLRAELAASVEAVKLAAAQHERLGPLHDKLNEVRSRVTEARGEQRKLTEAALTAESITIGHPAYAAITDCLARGDMFTANEYIEFVRRGQPVPTEATARNRFDHFFPKVASDLGEALSRQTGIPDLLRAVKAGAKFEGLDFSHPDLRRDVIGQHLNRWFQLGKKRNDNQNLSDNDIKLTLIQLGFNVVDVNQDRAGSRRAQWFEVRTEVVADRDRCPIPAFGSLAAGRYRVLAAEGSRAPEDVLTDISAGAEGSAVIVLYFGRLSDLRRRQFAALCHQRQRSVVVVDDCLFVYLNAEPDARLPLLFECTLPFAHAEPYTTTPGLVPVEMFYGRERERLSIVSPDGSCFIFGGRQLGKTALLRHAVRTFANSEIGHVAFWKDLKAAGLGYDKHIDAIWPLLATELTKERVLPPDTPPHAPTEVIEAGIKSWLDADQRRRIVVMLDESDRFLESDAKEDFVRSGRLKGWMDATNRRFKVVFAGLHNVQRATRLSNHPLAHLNEPICIGPLLEDGEWREARALVERPFDTLGFRFERPDMVMRVLAHTNYYPSLLQLFCNHLLRHVSGPRRSSFDLRLTPPCVITERHLEDVSRNQELWKQVRDRFTWTLQLDQRYEVIANAMSLQAREADGAGLVEGFSPVWVREQAVLYWEEGFRESQSDNAIRVLLDEMVGLGILRTCPEGRYALRNPNILPLMGSDEEIMSALVSDREKPLEYEAAAFRPVFQIRGEQPNPSRRSPLSAMQEQQLRTAENGVVLVCGTVAAGLSELSGYFEATFGTDRLILLGPLQEFDRFVRRLDEAIARRKEGLTLFVIGPDAAWTSRWMDHAMEKIGRLKKSDAFVRVVFCASPRIVWNLVALPAGLSRVPVISLEPWRTTAVRQAIDELGVGPRIEAERQEVRSSTGNWPSALAHWFEGVQRDGADWRQALKSTNEWINSSANTAEHLAAFGFDQLGSDQSAVLEVMRALAALERATASDLAVVLETTPEATVHRCMAWADRLNMVALGGEREWVIDVLVSRLVRVQAASGA